MQLDESDFSNYQKKLRRLVDDAIPRKLKVPIDQKTKDRIDNELLFIESYNNSAYFLAAAEILKYMKKAGHPVRCKGEGNASIIAYLIGLSVINPVKYDLPYEVCFGINGEGFKCFEFEYPWKAEKDLESIIHHLKLPDNIWISESEAVKRCESLKSKPIYFLKSKLLNRISDCMHITGSEIESIDYENHSIIKYLIRIFPKRKEIYVLDSEKWNCIVDIVNPNCIKSLATAFSLYTNVHIWNHVYKENLNIFIKRKFPVLCSKEDIYTRLQFYLEKDIALEITNFLCRGGFYWKEEPNVSRYLEILSVANTSEIWLEKCHEIKEVTSLSEALSFITYIYYFGYHKLTNPELIGK